LLLKIILAKMFMGILKKLLLLLFSIEAGNKLFAKIFAKLLRVGMPHLQKTNLKEPLLLIRPNKILNARRFCRYQLPTNPG
jgi:hypothetical protein